MQIAVVRVGNEALHAWTGTHVRGKRSRANMFIEKIAKREDCIGKSVKVYTEDQAQSCQMGV